MKIISLFTFSILLVCNINYATAQEENKDELKTLFKKSSGEKVVHGFYGAFNLGYSSLDDKSAMLIGGKGAWIIDHHIALGLAGYGFMNNLDKTTEQNKGSLSGGYGGFFFEPIIAPKAPVHVSFPILIGAGGVALYNNDNWNINNYDWDSFLVFEPGVEVEFNIVQFFRMSIGGSYRLTNGIVFHQVKNEIPLDALDGINFRINFKFGMF